MLPLQKTSGIQNTIKLHSDMYLQNLGKATEQKNLYIYIYIYI